MCTPHPACVFIAIVNGQFRRTWRQLQLSVVGVSHDRSRILTLIVVALAVFN
ncbi:hypothetical protein D3C85_651100 [compost metagenome]